MYQKRKLPAPCNIRVQICWHICNKILKRKAQLIWFCMTKKIQDYKLTLEHQYLQERNLYQLRGLYIGAKPLIPPPSRKIFFPLPVIWQNLLFKHSFGIFLPLLHLFYPFNLNIPLFLFSFLLFFHIFLFFSSIFHIFPLQVTLT